MLLVLVTIASILVWKIQSEGEHGATHPRVDHFFSFYREHGATHLSREVWCDLVENFGQLFGKVAGRPDSMDRSARTGGVTNRRSKGGRKLLTVG